VSGPVEQPEYLGEQVSELLAQQDANAILAACRLDAAANQDA